MFPVSIYSPIVAAESKLTTKAVPGDTAGEFKIGVFRNHYGHDAAVAASDFSPAFQRLSLPKTFAIRDCCFSPWKGGGY
jgi:hypothetical protein